MFNICIYYFNNILGFVCQISHRKYTTLKELDDVLGGADAWKNVSSTDG